ncbi:MAG: hypothetical protein ACOWYE_17645 [Desulfatiglandales bacterium]
MDLFWASIMVHNHGLYFISPDFPVGYTFYYLLEGLQEWEKAVFIHPSQRWRSVSEVIGRRGETCAGL